MVFNKKYLFVAVSVILLIGLFGMLNPLDNLMARDNASGRIAYVDVQKVFNVHPDKVSAEKELNEVAQSMQSELEKKAKDLAKDEQQALLKQYQSKLSQQEQELIQNVLIKIEEAIKEVARENEVRMVLDKKNVIYGGYDMTQDVINYIDKNQQDEKSEEQSDK